MADISDVTAYLAQQAAAAVYPNGTGSPSVTGMDCRISEGWPNAAQLDLDMAGNMKDPTTGAVVPRPGGAVANITVFPPNSAGAQVYQILDETYTISEPTFGLTFSLQGNVIVVSGTPAAGEYLTVICDDANVYSSGGATTAALLASLANAASGVYPGVTFTETTLTIPVGHAMLVRQGGVGVLGKVTHRQRQSVMVTVWAPTPAIRTTLAKAIDGLIKTANKVTLPDASQALVIFSRTNTIDDQQAQTIYRRDLIYDVEFATVEQFPGHVITSTQVSIVNYNATATATAIA